SVLRGDRGSCGTKTHRRGEGAASQERSERACPRTALGSGRQAARIHGDRGGARRAASAKRLLQDEGEIRSGEVPGVQVLAGVQLPADRGPGPKRGAAR